MKKKQQKKTGVKKEMHIRPLWGVLTFVCAVLCWVAFWDYEPEQSAWVSTRAMEPGYENKVGVLGATFSFFAFRYLGVGAWLLPAYCFLLASVLFSKRAGRVVWYRVGFLGVSLVAGSAFIHFLDQTLGLTLSVFAQHVYSAGLGGLWGYWVFGAFLKKIIGTFGGAMVLLVTMALGPALIIGDEQGRGLRALLESVRRVATSPGWIISFLERILMLSAKALRGLNRRIVEAFQRWRATRKLRPLAPVGPELPPEDSPKKSLSRFAKLLKPDEPEPLVAEPVALSRQAQAAPREAVTQEEGIRIVASEQTQRATLDYTHRDTGAYQRPDPNLLTVPAEAAYTSPEEHAQTANLLQQTLEEFGIKVTLGEVHTGPVITRYEVYPAAGVRVEKISNLDKNIAMSLKALAVRILAPVPGKGCVGVEVPNKRPTPVCIRDLLESKAWAENDAEIPLALGKEVSGKPLISDLTKMPHLLIAGSTGSGKTVCINSIITSLLFHAGPEDLRFIMVDPKIVEMQVYNSLPHMLIPVVTDPKKVPGALKWLLSEMERRYQIFAQMGVRNIAGFNAKQAKKKEAEAKQRELEAALSPEERVAVSNIEVPRDEGVQVPKKLPYIVCIIDELADLMMVAASDVETGIARLAQLARAAGIHLIIATQRPSVNVITGVIKANLPCRIAFRVASTVDSRTILDAKGADQLIGRGDFLFLPPGSASLVRAQGAFVSDEETHAMVEYLKRNGPPQYAVDVQEEIDSASGDEGFDTGSGDDDPIIQKAIDVLRSTKRASTSILQRRLSIGYNKAARIMEELEERGIVGPENGSKPREILQELV